MVAVANGASSAGVQADHHRTARPRSRASRQSPTSTNTPCGDLARLWKAARPLTRSSAMMSARPGASALSDTRCRPVALHRREVVGRLEEPARRRDAEFARDRRRRHLVHPRVPSGGRRAGEVGRHQALVGDDEDDVRQQGQLLDGVGDLAGDADGGPPRRPAVDGADHRLGAAFLRFAAEVGQLLLDQFRGRQREHVAARHARHLGEQLLGLAAPRRPDQHFDSNQHVSPEIARRTIAAGIEWLKCRRAGKWVRRVFIKEQLVTYLSRPERGPVLHRTGSVSRASGFALPPARTA